MAALIDLLVCVNKINAYFYDFMQTDMSDSAQKS